MKRFRLAPLGLGILIGVLIAGVGLSAVAVLAYGVPKIFSVEAASATPGQGFTGTVLARGTLGQNLVFGRPMVAVVKRKVRVKVRGRVVTRTVRIRVPAIERAIACNAANPCDSAFQQGTLQPGGTTGWHTHPGPTFVAFAQGDGTVYHVSGYACPGMKIGPGSGFTQMPTERHVLRNDGSVPIVVYTLYLLPHGTPTTGIRVDQPQPTECPSIN
jgi:mannose-6-phosphate isomerase-like protein (cupin superfamily)